MQTFLSAAVQMNALKDDLDHNLEVHRHFIREAGRLGCRLVLFPELSASSHYGAEEVVRFAEPAGDGPIYQAMLDAARQANLVVGYGFCESARGTFYNAHALLGPGGLIGVQHKLHASNDEYLQFRMGRQMQVFDLGFCRAGTLVCYDANFSEAWRVLALRGAELLLLPHASRTGWGQEVPPERQVQGIQAALDALPSPFGTYARENALYALFANQAGYNGHSTHAGGAYLLGPNGQPLARSKASLDDQLIVAELDPTLLDQARRSPNCTLKTRRPELYSDLTEML
jgi:N-carbamoylputrescine amidase